MCHSHAPQARFTSPFIVRIISNQSTITNITVMPPRIINITQRIHNHAHIRCAFIQALMVALLLQHSGSQLPFAGHFSSPPLSLYIAGSWQSLTQVASPHWPHIRFQVRPLPLMVDVTARAIAGVVHVNAGRHSSAGNVIAFHSHFSFLIIIITPITGQRQRITYNLPQAVSTRQQVIALIIHMVGNYQAIRSII